MAPEYDLSPEEQQGFSEQLQKLGMDPSQVVAELITGSTPGATILSDDPEIDSAIKPVMLVFHSSEDAKRLGSNADTLFDTSDIADADLPLKVGAFAIQNVTVSAGHPLVIAGDHQAYNFGIVTIEAGGEIQVTAKNVTMTCQKIVSNTDP